MLTTLLPQGHGALDAIYASVDAACATRGWDGVDLVIIGGDFQATRNAADLTLMSVPPKYRAMGDFHRYYAGARTAPYLTVFVGGNHEAAGHLWELFYGGWVAPNIYYWGAANVLRLGPLRLAGLSGIWKGPDYRQPHHERIPFRPEDTKSFYHVRELDVRKLLQVREPVDVGLSHDWPRAIERHGDAEQLFRRKPDFRRESMDGSLGNPAAEYVLDRLRPRYWFSAHMHCKFAAVKQFLPPEAAAVAVAPVQTVQDESLAKAPASTSNGGNPDEIDLAMDDDDDAGPMAPAGQQEMAKLADGAAASSHVEGVPSALLAQLPASFQRPQAPQHHRRGHPRPGQPVPPTITNTRVNFLALDKCLPGRHFLQLCEIGAADAAAAPLGEADEPTGRRPRFRLEYDPEWLAITRAFAKDLVVGERGTPVGPDLGEAHYRPLIDAERAWVEEHIVAQDRLAVPHDFAITAPVHAPVPSQPETHAEGQPDEYTNPHTAAFCALLQVPNVWHATEQERRERKQQGPGPSTSWYPRDGGGRHGDYRGRGRGSGGRGGRGGGDGGGYSRGGRGRGRGGRGC